MPSKKHAVNITKGNEIRKRLKKETKRRNFLKEKAKENLKEVIDLNFKVINPGCEGKCKNIATNIVVNKSNVIFYCDLCMSAFSVLLVELRKRGSESFKYLKDIDLD